MAAQTQEREARACFRAAVDLQICTSRTERASSASQVADWLPLPSAVVLLGLLAVNFLQPVEAQFPLNYPPTCSGSEGEPPGTLCLLLSRAAMRATHVVFDPLD